MGDPLLATSSRDRRGALGDEVMLVEAFLTLLAAV